MDARRRLAEWLDQKVGKRAASVHHQLWEPTVLEQWAAALRTPSMQRAHMECSGPHTLGTEFIRHVIEESPLMGRGRAGPKVGCRFGLRST